MEKLARRFQDAGGALSGPQPGLPAVRPRVFISYASEDADQARRLWDGLDRAGFEVWLDKVRLEGGDRWDPAIEQAIDQSDYVLVLQSRALVAKVDSYVNKEIALARERARRVAASVQVPHPARDRAGRSPSGSRSPIRAQRLGPEGYDDDLQKLVSIITRDYQLRHRERALLTSGQRAAAPVPRGSAVRRRRALAPAVLRPEARGARAGRPRDGAAAGRGLRQVGHGQELAHQRGPQGDALGQGRAALAGAAQRPRRRPVQDPLRGHRPGRWRTRTVEHTARHRRRPSGTTSRRPSSGAATSSSPRS